MLKSVLKGGGCLRQQDATERESKGHTAACAWRAAPEAEDVRAVGIGAQVHAFALLARPSLGSLGCGSCGELACPRRPSPRATAHATARTIAPARATVTVTARTTARIEACA